MININAQLYTYPVLGVSGAYLQPHDVFELQDYKFAKTGDGNMHVEGTLFMECELLAQYLKKGWCKAYLLTLSHGMVYRECLPMDTGRFSLVLKGASMYADSCKIRCVVAAERNIPDFFNPKYHNAEYGSPSLEIKRGMPMAMSCEIRTKKKADSVGSAIKVRQDQKLDKHVSFTVECGDNNDYIYIVARPNTKRQIYTMHKADRALFENVVLVPVLTYALKRMSECKQSAQWASALAEKCKSQKITQEEIDEHPHMVAQKLLYKNAALFERLKWDERSGCATGSGRIAVRGNEVEEEDDGYY